MRYVLSDDAKKDLQEIVKYFILKKDSSVVNNFLDELEESCSRFVRFPKIAPLVGDKMRVNSKYLGDMRLWAMSGFKKYVIFYVIEKSEVVIIRIIHSKRNIAIQFDN
jgi:toxin ParE1/3/4